MVDTSPPSEQGLRADGAEQRDVHRGGHDPPDVEVAGKGSVNLTITKQALRGRVMVRLMKQSECGQHRFCPWAQIAHGSRRRSPGCAEAYPMQSGIPHAI